MAANKSTADRVAIMPANKEEIGGSYAIRAKIGGDAEITVNGFYRHDVSKEEIDRALDLWSVAFKRQQAIADLDNREMMIAKAQSQIKMVQDDLDRLPKDTSALIGKRAADVLAERQNKVRVIAEAKAALIFNQLKHAEYLKLIHGEPHQAAAE